MSDSKLSLGGYEGFSWMVPCNYSYLSSPYGYRWHPVDGIWKFHSGIDLATSYGTPIYSLQKGIINYIGRNHESAGNYVKVKHTLTRTRIDGQITEITYESRYLHMSSFAEGIYEGKSVEQGTLIGYVGSTGKSTGPHLHLGLRREGTEVDPALYIFGTEQITEPVQFWEHKEKESIKHNDWLPLYSNKGGHRPSTEGTSQGQFSRRQHIISNYTYNILDGVKSNNRLFGGISDIGLNVQYSLASSHNNTRSLKLPEISKDQVVAQYYTKSTGYRKDELPNNIKSSTSGPWLIVGTYIANYLINNGWTSPQAICALLGNMGAECGMNPARYQCNDLPKNVATYGGGFGLIQWTPPHEYFNSSDLDNHYNSPPYNTPYDIDTQLNKILSELNGVGSVYFTKKGSGLDTYINSIQKTNNSDWEQWNCDAGSRQAILEYLNTHKSDGIEVKGTKFGESTLPVELLTIAYALNRERPNSKSWAPQKRVGYALTFYKLIFGGAGSIHYTFSTDPTEVPCSDPLNCGEVWQSKKKSEEYINPYPVVSATACVLPSNNAYCWGLCYSNHNNEDLSLQLAESYSTDWFEYNKNNNIYEYGITPRIGCIACWTYKNYDKNNKRDELSCVGYVTEVLGSDALKISWIKHKPGGYSASDIIEEAHNGKDDINRVLTNYNNNWGLDTKDYKFRGFIYLKNIDEVSSAVTIEDNDYCVQSTSNGSNYSSITIALKDSKHYNKLRLIYDVEIFPPQHEKEDFDLDVYYYCNRYIFFSQRIVSTNVLPTNEEGKVDVSSKLPKFSKNNDNDKNDLFLRGPFPKGHLLVSNSIGRGREFRVKHIDDKDMLYLEDVDETFDISKFRGNGVITELYSQDIDNPQDKEHELTQYFDREFPSYINIVTMAKPYKKGEDEFNSNIKLRIKKVILYK